LLSKLFSFWACFLNKYVVYWDAKLHDLYEIAKQFNTNQVITALYFAIISEKRIKICKFEINSISLRPYC